MQTHKSAILHKYHVNFMAEKVESSPSPKTSKSRTAKSKSSLKLTIEPNMCKGCGYCISACPKNVLVMSKDLSAKGIEIVEIIHPELCIQCRNCELICPDMAIYLEDATNPPDEKGACTT
jgi:2-oxoglutarate ferredoxin oxidoreductase subunit delta